MYPSLSAMEVNHGLNTHSVALLVDTKSRLTSCQRACQIKDRNHFCIPILVDLSTRQLTQCIIIHLILDLVPKYKIKKLYIERNTTSQTFCHLWWLWKEVTLCEFTACVLRAYPYLKPLQHYLIRTTKNYSTNMFDSMIQYFSSSLQ